LTPDRQDRPREPNPASLRKRFLRQPRTLDLPRPTASGRQRPADVGRGVVQSCRKLFLSNPPSSSWIDFCLFHHSLRMIGYFLKCLVCPKNSFSFILTTQLNSPSPSPSPIAKWHTKSHTVTKIESNVGPEIE
jgi:hypothetical protein